MMGEDGRKCRPTVCMAAVFILLSCFTPTAHCYKSNTTGRSRRKGAAAAEMTAGVQEGEIMFGDSASVQPRSKRPFSHSVGYESDVQAVPPGNKQDAASAQMAWRGMSPKLHCGGNQMKLQAKGPGASLFQLEQGSGPLLPLGQVPATCGYSMHRNPLGLVMLAPYDGCNVLQQMGSYILPMRWQGIPISLCCPKATTALPTTADPPTTEILTAPTIKATPAPTIKATPAPTMAQFIPPLYPYHPWYYPWYPYNPKDTFHTTATEAPAPEATVPVAETTVPPQLVPPWFSYLNPILPPNTPNIKPPVGNPMHPPPYYSPYNVPHPSMPFYNPLVFKPLEPRIPEDPQIKPATRPLKPPGPLIPQYSQPMMKPQGPLPQNSQPLMKPQGPLPQYSQPMNNLFYPGIHPGILPPPKPPMMQPQEPRIPQYPNIKPAKPPMTKPQDPHNPQYGPPIPQYSQHPWGLLPQPR